VNGRDARRIAGVLAALVLFAGCVTATTEAAAVTTSPGSGGIGVRLLADGPGSSAGPLSLSYVVERMAPGSQLTRQVEVSNTTDVTSQIAVYAAGAGIVRNQFAFAPGTAGDQLSEWTSIGRSVLSLAPGAVARESLTIAVPASAPSGERYAVIWAELSAPSPTQRGVRLVNWVGIRMYVSVGPGGMPAPAFTVGPLSTSRSSSGNLLVVATVHNIGQAALDITGGLSLSHGPGGLSAGPFPIEIGTLLPPGHSVIERGQLDSQIPRGPWKAVLALSSSGTRHHSVATITFPTAPVGGGGRTPAAPFVLAALLLLMILVLAGVAMLLSRRRRHGLTPSA